MLTDLYDPNKPRERILTFGVEQASVEELLATVLGTGSRGVPAIELARHVLTHMGGIAGLARATPRELTTVSGIGEARAVRLASAFRLARYASAERRTEVAITCAEDVFTLLQPRVCGLAQEVFGVLGLDARNTIIAQIEVARGTLTNVEVHPREVFRPLIRSSAAATILFHNHPSGDPTPSVEDVTLTIRLRQVGELVGIPVLDHIILGDGEYTSVAEYLVCEEETGPA